MGTPALWIVVAVSEVVALALIFRLWRSGERPAMKVMLTLLALVPVLGPFFVLWVARFPPRVPPGMQNRSPRGQPYYYLDWMHVMQMKSPIRRFRAWKTQAEEENNPGRRPPW